MSRRHDLLADLYGDAAADTAAAIDRLIQSHRRAPRPVPRWSHEDVWMIAYPDQFGPTGIDGVGEVVDALAPRINGVHILPFHRSTSDGGFAVVDFAEVDPAVGDWPAVARVGARHRLMADAVINHLSPSGPWFQGDLRGEPNYAGFFRRIEPGTDLSAVVRPRPGPPVAEVTGPDGATVSFWATFSADQIDLDYRNPAVLLAVLDAILRFVDHDAVAIRLDAVAFVGKDPATPSIHSAETHAIVALLRDVVHEVDPGVVLVTETNVPHEDNVAYFGSPAVPEAHAVYQFTLAPLVLHAVTTGDAAPLRAWAATIETQSTTTFLNFLASHDGVGVRPAKGWLHPAQIDALAAHSRACGGAVNMAATLDGDEPYELTATWRSLMEGVPGSVDDTTVVARHLAAHAVALALPGLPLLYTHSLVGSVNDAARVAATGVARDINRPRFADPTHFLDAMADETGVAGRVWQGLARMLDQRRQHVAFDPSSPHRIVPSAGATFVVERGSPVGPKALVAVNLGPATARVTLEGSWSALDGAPVDGTIELAGWARILLIRD